MSTARLRKALLNVEIRQSTNLLVTCITPRCAYIHYYACSIEEIFLHDCLVVLKLRPICIISRVLCV